MEQKNETLLEIHDLSVSFRMYDGTLEQMQILIKNIQEILEG